MTIYAHIVGWGKYIPEHVVTNHDLETLLDTSDKWIQERTGIKERRHAAPDETTASIAIYAAQEALDRARISPSAVDLIIVASLSPEHIMPSTASIVQDAIGATKAGAFDLSAACAGFAYALTTGAAAIKAGDAEVVLVIGSETVSRFLNPQDRGTYPLFGDGAGALVLKADHMPGGVLSTVLGSDGSGAEHLTIPGGGSKYPPTCESVTQGLHYMHMNGREVYRFATRVMGRAAKEACDKAGVGLDEVDLFIPHQANIRIIQSAAKYLNLNEEKIFTNLHRYGNTSTASIPIALCEAIEEGRIRTKDKLVMVGFGGGLCWGAIVVEWGLPMPHRRRQWWYRGLRWMLYRWANMRSLGRRVRRRIENLLPARNGEVDIPKVEPKSDPKPEIEIIHPAEPGTNGHTSNGKQKMLPPGDAEFEEKPRKKK